MTSSAETSMVGGTEKKLYDAVLTGDATAFKQLVDEDPLLLDRVSFLYPNKSPLLHIAVMKGDLTIIEVTLTRNPKLVRQLDWQKSSLLHIAAVQGYASIASTLWLVAPEMCWLRDCHGMNPIHVAALYGRLDVLVALIRRDPSPAREKVDRGQTVLHLCVKYGRINALQLLVERLCELILVKDDDGDTILHLAARYKQYKIIQYLVENNIIEKSIRNSKGETALDILEEFPPDETLSKFKETLRTCWWRGSPKSLDRFREIGLVISILIAAMAFQALISPPGGVWQENSSTHRAGTAIMAYTHPKIYKDFILANTIAFASSMIIIFLLTTRLSSIHILVTVAVMHAMWVSVASIAVSYGASLMVITPNMETQSLASVIWTVAAVTVIIVGAFWVRRFYRLRKTFKNDVSHIHYTSSISLDSITSQIAKDVITSLT